MRITLAFIGTNLQTFYEDKICFFEQPIIFNITDSKLNITINPFGNVLLYYVLRIQKS